jgi:transcriptional regulator of arginine metabolism
VVVKTKAGYAGVAAKEIENQAPERVLGTIAGEDTILVILREQSDPQQLRDLLRAAMQ